MANLSTNNFYKHLKQKNNQAPSNPCAAYCIMHKSFVTTAPPPTGKGGDYDFSVSVPCYKPHPQGANWRYLPTLSNRKSPWGKDPNVKTLSFISPALRTAETLEKQLPHTLAKLSPILPCSGGGGGGGRQQLQMTYANA